MKSISGLGDDEMQMTMAIREDNVELSHVYRRLNDTRLLATDENLQGLTD